MRLLRLVILLTAVAIVVFPAGIALGQPPPANAVRALPDTVERGETFNITVNFTAPADNFSAIALTDFAPDGWNVTVDGSWCTPAATHNDHGNNMADYSWWTETYNVSEPFTAKYKIKVPCDANLTNYTFDSSNLAYLAYFIGADPNHIYESITGDFNVTVVPPAICSTPSIDFYAAENGTNPQNQTLDVWSSTPCWLNNWSLTDDAVYNVTHDWLEAYPTNGSCNDTYVSSVNLSVNSSGMPLGNYTANITIESPDANNSPRIVPVTLHITLTGTLEGQVSFYRAEDPGDPTWETPIVVSFFGNSTRLEMDWSPINVTTDAYGNFTIEDIVVGTYDIGIKNYTSLSRMVYGKDFTAGNVTPANFTLIEGDTDDNDMVDGWDYSLVLNNYGAMRIADPAGWATNEFWRGDFNRDYTLDGWDYAAVLNNYGDFGEIFLYIITH